MFSNHKNGTKCFFCCCKKPAAASCSFEELLFCCVAMADQSFGFLPWLKKCHTSIDNRMEPNISNFILGQLTFGWILGLKWALNSQPLIGFCPATTWTIFWHHCDPGSIVSPGHYRSEGTCVRVDIFCNILKYWSLFTEPAPRPIRSIGCNGRGMMYVVPYSEFFAGP